jgi:hypothetical protein
VLGTWRYHAEFLAFMIPAFLSDVAANHNTLSVYGSAFQKMFCLNLDSALEDFLPLFSMCGKPSNQQPEIFRSLILMSHFRFPSIDNWVKHAKAHKVICDLVGVEPNNFPGASTHRDFYNRLWQDPVFSHIMNLNSSKPKAKLGKNQKLPPKNPGIINKMVDKALSGKTFDCIPERLYQTIFMKLAVLPSAALGLLGDLHNIIADADGSCVSSHANPYGHSLDPEIYPPGYVENYRDFRDPIARWGWDSYHECWYFGYTMYLLSVHNSERHIDLPIYMRFVGANRFDGVTLIASLAHARVMYKGILDFYALAADSAHDNYPTYRMLNKFNIIPFIDLNTRTGKADVNDSNKNDKNNKDIKPKKNSKNNQSNIKTTTDKAIVNTPQEKPGIPEFTDGRKPMKNKVCVPASTRADGVQLSENGIPVCRIGIEMTNWGCDKKRYRIKYRCPLKAGSICSCKYIDECSKSDYGKIVYIKPLDDPRLYPPVLRGTDEWKKIYNNRTAAERVNTRILTDYKLEQPKRYGKKKLCFFAFCAATNLHLDAQIKLKKFNIVAAFRKEVA